MVGEIQANRKGFGGILWRSQEPNASNCMRLGWIAAQLRPRPVTGTVKDLKDLGHTVKSLRCSRFGVWTGSRAVTGRALQVFGAWEGCRGAQVRDSWHGDTSFSQVSCPASSFEGLDAMNIQGPKSPQRELRPARWHSASCGPGERGYALCGAWLLGCIPWGT